MLFRSKQMDAQVDQTLSRTTDDKGAERSLQIRRGQQKERSALLAEIGSAQTRIARLNEERAPIASELRKVEAEVGPIKYIAALLYGDNPDQTILEKAVRIVIIMIVLVFDPLAVLLLMAANTQIVTKKEEDNDSNHNTEEVSTEEEPTSEENPFKEKANIIKERFFNKFKRTAKEPSVEQRTTESDSTSGDTEDDRSAGVSVTTKDDIFPEDKVVDWTITPPPSEPKIVEKVEYDSAGRIHKTHYVRQSVVDGKTIEEEVEDLQNTKSN